MSVSGEMIEVYTYEKPVITNRARLREYKKPMGRTNQATDQDKQKNRDITLRRARKTIQRLVHANCDQWFDEHGKRYKPVFITLTYAATMEDTVQGNRDYRSYMKRLNYHLYKDKKSHLKYLAIPEFQDRGSLHYHAVVFNLPFIPIDELQTLWKHGGINISVIKDKYRIASYMTKTIWPEKHDQRFMGHKCYLTSQGLLKPKESTDRHWIDKVTLNMAKKKTYEVLFENDRYGKIKYERYKADD